MFLIRRIVGQKIIMLGQAMTSAAWWGLGVGNGAADEAIDEAWNRIRKSRPRTLIHDAGDGIACFGDGTVMPDCVTQIDLCDNSFRQVPGSWRGVIGEARAGDLEARWARWVRPRR